MPEDVLPGETPAEPTQPAGQEPQTVLGTDGQPFDPERAKATIDKLRGYEKEAEKLRKENDALKDAEQKRKEAEMSEIDRLKAQNAQMEAELKQRRTNDTKRAIAAEIGLPDVLALRIQGDDDEAMKADAQKLFDALPKGETVTKKVTAVTNPPSGQTVKESEEAQRARIYGQSTVSIFDPGYAAQHGGGVVYKDRAKKE